MTKATVRRAISSDKYAVSELVKQACVEFGWTFSSDFSTDDYDPDYYRLPSAMYVAEVNGSVVGSAAFLKKGIYGLLVRFYLRRDYRGHGIGLQLYNAITSVARLRHTQFLLLGTEPENLPYLFPFLLHNHFTRIDHPPVNFNRETSSLYFQTPLNGLGNNGQSHNNRPRNSHKGSA